MKRIARAQPIIALTERLALPDNIASRLRLYEDESPSHNGRVHMTLEFIEQRGNGTGAREVPIASRYAEKARMNEILESDEEVATFIDLAVGACKKDDKPELPAFIRDNSVAKNARQMMRKVSKIASAALLSNHVVA